MTTKEAIQAMLDGKKVKVTEWTEHEGYLYYDQHLGFMDEKEETYNINDLIDEEEWEIYEKPNLKKQ